ncbi:exonuclease mut-7 homolog [Genypterus blacodes]|uniref:exonuclease mut-7 homolog n=1 Tax=Genypterus blacodes TaxID=154954 RepID=UPI003F758DBB
MNLATPDAMGVDPAVLRDQLFELWNWKDLTTLHLAAHQGFSKLREPLEAILTILEGCPGKQKGRGHTLGHHVLMEFQTWMQDNPQVSLDAHSDQEALALQHRALGILTDSQNNFIDAVVNIYQLNALDPATLRQHVERLQAFTSYKEAATLSIKLKLQNVVNMEEICVPLILQDKMSLAESFVTGHRHLEERLVTLLDSWCHPSFNAGEIRRQFPHLSLSTHCMSQINAKMLAKRVLRLMEKFNIDSALCPNALHKQRLDSLRFLMYKRFVEKSMIEENWSDHVQSVVADDPELQILLVEMLVKYCGVRKASQWSLRYRIPKYRLPFGVWDAQQTVPQLECVSEPANTAAEWTPPDSHRQRFYQLPLTKEQVHFVDTAEGLQRCRHVALQEGAIVGVDMEWPPTFGCVSAQHVALIQLAVVGQVFLLDLSANSFRQNPDTIAFIRDFFSERKILKLGYGMGGDTKCLLATWQQLSEEPLKMEGVLDLLSVHQKIQRAPASRTRSGPKAVLVGEDSAEKGLSLLVRQILGKPLDKTEQMSNWKKRPLRTSQIRYAAADAYCLLDVYSALSGDPARFGLPADLRAPSSSSSFSSSEKQRDKRAKQKKRNSDNQECQGAQRVSPTRCDAEKGLLCGEKEPPTAAAANAATSLAPQQLRVVCDNMLQGLGRYLRCLGIDVVILENTDDHREAAKLAQEEGRVILTCGQPYQSLRSQVGEGRCLALDCSEKARDQAVRVLRHFNVQPTPSHVFSRCQVCNNDEYLAVPRENMTTMLRQKGFLQDHAQPNSPHQDQEALGDVPTSSATPDLPRYALQCRWAPPSALDPDTLTFPSGAQVQLHAVPPGLLPRIPLFYACTRCGKVFWEGSHFGRVLTQFEDILRLKDEVSDSNGRATPRN